MALTVALMAAACASPPTRWEPDTDPVPVDFRPIDVVERRLRQVVPDHEGDLWSITEGNSLDGDWLLQTPDCWGQSTCGSPQGFERFLRTIEDDISGAETVVDIVTLNPFPSGEFRAAVVEGLRRGWDAGNRPTVRIYAGFYPFGDSVAQPFGDFTLESVADYGSTLLRDVGGAAALGIPLVTARVYSHVLFSWNHSKTIAVDGRSAITGGHNLWAGSYLQTSDPIHDVSMRVEGPAAGDAQRFANRLWHHACAPGPVGGTVAWNSPALSGCPSQLDPPESSISGDVRVMSLGSLGIEIDASVPVGGTVQPDNPGACGPFPDLSNLGGVAYDAQNPAEEALRSFIGSARQQVFLSQQDLIGICPIARYDVRLMDALVDRLMAGVTVTIVLSSPGATTASSTGYSNVASLDEVVEVLWAHALAKAGGDRVAARAAVCAHLQLAPLRFSETDAWANGRLFGNHAKVIAVDRQAFSVGSSNLYPSWLAEFAYLVDDDAASEDFYSQYLDPLWAHSRRAAVIDADQSRCALPSA